MTMLSCGPDLSMDQYIECFNKNVTWVSGMSGGELTSKHSNVVN